MTNDVGRWSLLVVFSPIIEQGWEEQNEGEDFAARVINAVKGFWEYDDEISNDYRGQGFDGETFWSLNEDRTELRLSAEILDQLALAIDAVLKRTIPRMMVLVNDQAWPDDIAFTILP